MFTGIIQALGKVESVEHLDGDIRLRVSAEGIDWKRVNVGDSIATNGVCLTAAELNEDGYFADVSVETIALTTVASWEQGMPLNLELSLTPEARMGGHIVSGHIDGIGEVISRTSDARSENFQVRAPQSLAKYIAQKGSVAVDGISLTINKIEGDIFALTIVPHTLGNTVMDGYQEGTKVNLEVDVIARYLERLLEGQQSTDAETKPSRIDESFLTEHGYIQNFAKGYRK